MGMLMGERLYAARHGLKLEGPMQYTFKVNGNTVTSENGEKSLLRFLREDLKLFGAKDGCSKGQCGACTVIVNKKAVRACTRKL